jgi:hypothetical protein
VGLARKQKGHDSPQKTHAHFREMRDGGLELCRSLSTLCFGIGLGLAIPTTNLLVSELNPEKPASAFGWLGLA